ncbi:MAG: endonuclease MutS2, partial [Caldilineaceae bacterium]
MHPRTLAVLEYGKILDRVAARCAFSGGQERALALLPSDDLVTVHTWLAQTAEAVRLLEQKSDIHFGGVRDVRPYADKAARSAMLLAPELLEVRQTLLRARALRTLLTRIESGFPHLSELGVAIEHCDELTAQIGRCISDRGDVQDSASDALLRIRAEL